MDDKISEELTKDGGDDPPNEQPLVHIEDHIKIYDPISKEILINKR